jgi:hypothetical protein
LQPVSLIATVPFALVVNPAFPAKDAKEFLALVRANPGKYTFASSGTGATAHMFAVLFKSMAQLKAVHVPYKGSVPALTDLIGGQVDRRAARRRDPEGDAVARPPGALRPDRQVGRHQDRAVGASLPAASGTALQDSSWRLCTTRLPPRRSARPVAYSIASRRSPKLATVLRAPDSVTRQRPLL